MKKYINKTLLAAAALCIGLSGCIKETLPSDFILDSQITSDAAVAGLVNGIYTTMAGYKNADGGIEMISYAGLRAMMEHATTPMICSGHSGYNTMGVWHYGSISSLTSNRGIYPTYVYPAYIMTANNIIDRINRINPENRTTAQLVYLGFAHAFRALYYMELVQVMEYKYPTDNRFTYVLPENDLHNLGVPIVTEKTTIEEATRNPRATVDEVFKLVLSDLETAETYLENYTRSDKIQPDLSAVYGLYARVYSCLASRVDRSATYKDEAAYWGKVQTYADLAITTSGCTPLTEEEWTDPDNGFNNRTSQNSWMWATTISENNTAASSTESFVFSMIFGTETTFSVYGWRVGRSLDRRWYERLSDNDFRKKSWLAPNFFYESTNQVDGQPYLVEKDAQGKFINNKWTANTDGYSGWGPTKYQYLLNSSPSWIRSRITVANGFEGWPWLYVNLKFRPHNGNYNTYTIGGATDYPIMRVEEMHFLKAEAALHLTGVSAAATALEDIVKTRNPGYVCTAATEEDFIEEYAFQKGIEFWGEGVNYFDAKRLELGIHRAYLGSNAHIFNQLLDMDGVFVGWTPPFNAAELACNPAIARYNNPYTNPANYHTIKSNDEFRPYYGADL